MGSKGSQTSTSSSTTAPDPQAYAAYSDLLKRAAGVAATPYQAYSGELTAPVNAQQSQGIAGVNSNANYAQPFIGQAANYANDAAAPITGQQIAQYSDPFTQQVINATQAQFNDQNAQQQSALTGNAIAQGALGGNRTGVAAANLAGQQQRAQAPVIAGLQSQGYQTGLQTALSQQQAKAQAAYSLGNLGVAGQNAALTGAGAQIGAGTLEQGTQQAADTANYGQFQQGQAYPFQTAQWLAGLDTGVGSQMGGTSSGTQTQPAPNSTASWLGLGLSGVGALGQAGAFAPLLAMSDRRAKEDISHIGETKDGQKLYRYRYKGSPQWHIGLIAQDVEKHHPEAVYSGVAGYKMLDLKAATEDAATKRARGGVVPHYDAGGGIGGSPYAGVMGWVPSIGISAGRGAPAAPQAGGGQKQQAADPSKLAGQVSSLVKGFKNGFGFSGAAPTDLTPPGVASGFGGDSSGFAYAGGPDSGLGAMYADGGLVQGVGRYDFGGGVPSPFDDFGGDANNASTDIPAALAPGGLGPIDTGPAIAQTAGVTPFSPTPDRVAAKGDQLPVAGGVAPAMDAPINVAQRPGDAGTGVNVPMAADAGVQRAPVPVAGVGPAPDQADPQADYGMQHFGHAIGSIESSNNYLAVTDTGKGDAAYGYYQVLGKNIPSWTREVLGVSMTPQQFLHNDKAQDAVFRAKFGSYLAKTGNPDDAAAMWFSGRPMAEAGNAHDILGTSVPDYVRKFRTALGQTAGVDYADNGTGVSGAGSDHIPANAALAQGVAPAGVAPANHDALWQGLMAAGLGMMASRSPFLGQAIGEGGLQGLKAYTGVNAAQQKSSIENRRVDLDAQRLSQSADKAQKDLDLRTKALAETHEYHQAETNRGNFQMLGTGEDGNPILMDTRSGKTIQGKEALKTIGRTAGVSMDDDTAQFLADRVRAGDTRALVGLGRGAQGAQNLTKIQAIVARDAAAGKEVNPQAQSIMDNASEQMGYTASQRTFGTQTAKMAINTREAAGAIQLGREASANVPRGTWVPVNKAVQAYLSGTSDPALAQFGAANLAIINTYARAISPTGVPTVNDKQHAEQMLSTATGPAAYEAVLKQFEKEIAIAHGAAPAAKKELKDLRTGTAPTATTAAPVYREGQTATGPDGRKITYHNGRWE